MTLHVELGIGEALTRLAVARGGMLDDITSEVYLDRLERFDPALVARACEHWADIPRREFETTLPAVGDLISTIERIAREDAAEVARKKLLPLPKSAGEWEPTFFCRDCWDEPSGWRLFWCQGVGDERDLEPNPRGLGLSFAHCGRKFPHGPHSFADRCSCRDVNPVIAKHRQRHAEFVTKRDEKRRSK